MNMNRIKGKTYNLLHAENRFDKIQHTFLIKKRSTQQTRKRRKLNLTKAIYEKKKKKKPTANIVLNGERLKLFPTRSGRFLV